MKIIFLMLLSSLAFSCATTSIDRSPAGAEATNVSGQWLQFMGLPTERPSTLTGYTVLQTDFGLEPAPCTLQVIPENSAGGLNVQINGTFPRQKSTKLIEKFELKMSISGPRLRVRKLEGSGLDVENAYLTTTRVVVKPHEDTPDFFKIRFIQFTYTDKNDIICAYLRKGKNNP